MSFPDEAWQRLGRMLIAQRVALNPQWRNRQRFVEATHLNERLVSDLEKGRRQAYRDSTLDAVERAYRVAPGSVHRALSDPEFTFPEPKPHGPAAVSDDADEHPDVHVPGTVALEDLESWERHIWLTPELSVEQRAVALRFLRLLRGDLAGEADTLATLISVLQAIIAEADPAPAPRP